MKLFSKSVPPASAPVPKVTKFAVHETGGAIVDTVDDPHAARQLADYMTRTTKKQHVVHPVEVEVDAV